MVLVIGNWYFGIVWDLEFGIWNLITNLIGLRLYWGRSEE